MQPDSSEERFLGRSVREKSPGDALHIPLWQNISMNETRPRFRPDILLHAYDEAYGGQSVILEDPVSNKFFRISSYEFELLKVLDGTRSLRESIERLKLSGRYFTLNQAAKLVDKFSKAGLLLGTIYGTSGIQKELKERVETELHTRSILKLYYLYIPLLNPDAFLQKTLFLWRMLVNRVTLTVLFCLIPGALYLLITGFKRFDVEYLFFFNIQNLIVLWIALVLVKLVHEFAHAYVAKSRGLRVPEMGIAFLIFFPCLYCNTTAAWQLSDRRERMLISLAGILSELAVAVFAIYIWYFTKPGIVNSVAFYLMAISVISSLFFNGNPLLKFDGYFVLIDWLRMPNLQAKSFGVLRYLFMNRVLGIDSVEIPPSSGREFSILVSYGVSAVLYRFVLYAGILERIYTKFDKTLGLILAATAFFMFIVRPLSRGAMNLFRKKSEMRFRPRGVAVFLIVSIGVIALISFPWSDHSVYPCYLESVLVRQIVVPAEAPVSQVSVKQGDSVRSGEVIFRLNPLPLKYALKDKHAEHRLVRTEIAIIRDSQQDLHKLDLKYIELSQIEDAMKRIEEDLALIEWKAPFDGAITALSPVFQPGASPGKGTVVGEMASRTACEVQALLPESDVSAIMKNGTVTAWWPVGTGMTMNLTVKEIDPFKTENLDGSPFSSRFGGEIATEIRDQIGKDAPLDPYYLCRMDFPNPTGIPLGMTGRLVVKHPPKSILRRVVDAAYGTFHREVVF